MKLTGKTEDGPVITDLDSWFKYAPPVSGSAQWKDYRSAKELGQAWCRYGQVRCPEEVSSVLAVRKETRGLVIEQAVAEMEIPFDEFRPGRNADLALWGHLENQRGRVVVTVEAKADEAFGKTIEQARAQASDTSNIPERIARLSRGIIGRDVDHLVGPLGYQLFYALAATAAIARDKQADLGVLIIHEFVSLAIDFDKLIDNANDLKAFVRAIPGWDKQSLKAGYLLPPIRLTGSESVPNDVHVSIGKIRTLIPLGAGGRRTTATVDGNTNQFVLIEGQSPGAEMPADGKTSLTEST